MLEDCLTVNGHSMSNPILTKTERWIWMPPGVWK